MFLGGYTGRPALRYQPQINLGFDPAHGVVAGDPEVHLRLSGVSPA
jgi:hypothetical protein